MSVPATAPLVVQSQSPLQYVSLAKGFEHLLSEIPSGVDVTPSMMSVGERKILYNLAARHWRGGAIVDAGLMLGASTVLFGRALQTHPEVRGRPIVSIDNAIASPGAVRFIGRHAPEAHIRDGDNFADLIRRFIAPVEQFVDLRIGNLTEVGKVGGKIDILFLDALKDAETCRYSTLNFFPRLVAGSFVLQQDYLIDALPVIRQQQEHLILTENCFSYVGEAGPMAIFACRRRPSVQSCEEAAGELPYDHVQKLLSAAEQRSIDPYRRALCAMGRVWRAAASRGPDEAAKVMSGIRQCYAAQIEARRYKRLNNAVAAAEFLCSSQWSPETEYRAALLAAGLPVDQPAHAANP